MYVTIDQTEYTTLKNLSFAPETDVTGSAVPINEFSVDVVTTDDISVGQYAELYDDLDNLWAKYWIVYAEHAGANIVQIRARSDIALLDGVTLPAVMYTDEPVGDVLDDTMVRTAGGGLVAPIDYSLDNSFASDTITGFCPEQSARERLQWVCFVLGAYVKTSFNSEIEILPTDTTATTVPKANTYWKPKITHKDYVTAVTVKGYAFTVASGDPDVTDTWVTDGTNTYIVTETAYTLTNTDAPSGVADNVVTVEGVYLINQYNADAILAHLAALYFKRTEVELDVINNAQYAPGDKLSVYADDSMMCSGFVRSCAFVFGVQAKAKMKLIASDSVECATLTVTYTYNDINVSVEEYDIPVGGTYSITTRYIDTTMNGHRYILRPSTVTISGTMTSAGATATVTCTVALDYHDGVLTVSNVDSATQSSGVVAIG